MMVGDSRCLYLKVGQDSVVKYVEEFSVKSRISYLRNLSRSIAPKDVWISSRGPDHPNADTLSKTGNCTLNKQNVPESSSKQ